MLLAVAVMFGGRAFAAEEDEPVPAAEDDALAIIAQPEDLCVAYPNEARFHVEVNHPEQVASYQWYMSDGYNSYELDGISAGTDTLVIPATEWSENPLYFECGITDTQGNRYWSDDAELTIANLEEAVPRLYVGEYVLLPGGQIDLSDTIYGSGIISFAEDMNSITLDQVRFNNDRAVMDRLFSPSYGLFLEGIPEEEHREFAVHCIGDNVFENTFFDGTNSGGVTINLFFAPHYVETIPTVTIDGSGTLTVLGGERCINMDSDLVIGVPVTASTLEGHYCDAIRTSFDVVICEGVNVDLTSVGEGIGASGAVIMEKGSGLSVNMEAPFFMQGTGMASAIRGTQGVYCEDAQITISGTAKPDRFIENNKKSSGFVGIKATEGDIVLDSTKVSVEFSVVKAEENYVAALRGIAGDVNDADLVLKNGSEFSMTLNDEPDVTVACGISMFRSVAIEDSTVDLDLASTGKTGGIGDHYIVDIRNLTIYDSNLDIRTDCTGEESSWGIRCMGPAEISFSDCSYSVYSSSADGPALMTVFGLDEFNPAEHPESPCSYDPDYQPERLLLPEDARIELPAGGTVSCYAMPFEGEVFMKAETVYDPSDLTAPASEVLISGPHIPETVAEETIPVSYAEPEHVIADRVCTACGEELPKETISTSGKSLKEQAADAMTAYETAAEKAANSSGEAAVAPAEAAVEAAEAAKEAADKALAAAEAEAAAGTLDAAELVNAQATAEKAAQAVSNAKDISAAAQAGAIEAADVRDEAVVALAQLDSLVKKNLYTTSTYKSYKTAYDAFKALALKDSATADQLREARSNVAKAYLKLKLKAAQPMKVKANTKTVKLKKLKKANQTVTKAITVSKAQGKVTYKKTSGNAKITIHSSTGKITVKKGLKKGTYKIKIKVTAAGNANYKAGSKTVTVTIKVK